MNSKRLFMSTLIATVLLVVVFTPISNQAGSYDPWVDINGDGKIDGRDVASTAASFGTLGDPTRNVTVTNFPKEPEPKTIVVLQNYNLTFPAPMYWFLATANVTGYRLVSIFVEYYDSDGVDQDIYYRQSCEGIGSGWYAPIPMQNDYGSYETGINRVEVGAPSLDFRAYSYNAGAIRLTILLYCYN